MFESMKLCDVKILVALINYAKKDYFLVPKQKPPLTFLMTIEKVRGAFVLELEVTPPRVGAK